MSPGETIPYPASPTPTRPRAKRREAKLQASPLPSVARLQRKMLAARTAARTDPVVAAAAAEDDVPLSRLGVALIVVAFIALQGTNSTVVSVMSLFVTQSLGLNVIWAGIALGVAAGLEIPQGGSLW